MVSIFQKIAAFFKREGNLISFAPLAVDPRAEYANYSHLYYPDYIFNDRFYANLVSTINWTEHIIANISDLSQINYSTVLRATNPIYRESPFYRYENTWAGFAATPDISFNYLTVLKEALAVRKDSRETIINPCDYGQVLEFDIDLTTHDGGPCTASDGFVDESDIPPIDTWFYLTKTKLYCWIPNMFIEKMQAAIDVEILDSYRWVKDPHPALQSEIMSRLR